MLKGGDDLMGTVLSICEVLHTIKSFGKQAAGISKCYLLFP